jgi:NAD(P)-dependent dehydrogenase (short-subunit alcohol dehydrogenase family)
VSSIQLETRQHSRFDLTGKTAVITGASKGIGRAIALDMARAGARVVVSSRKLPACEEVVKAIGQEGGKAIAIPCNIGHKDEIETLIGRSKDAFETIDILVCNAAVNPYYGPLVEIQDDMFDRIMTANVRSNLRLCGLVLPEMAERHDGSIIIISSILGLFGTATMGTYAISKAADFQLVRNLAVEWGESNIRINCIAPGLVKTDFARALWEKDEIREKALSHTPLRRMGEPEDISGVAVFLASAAARYITGQQIVVDGGTVICSRL